MGVAFPMVRQRVRAIRSRLVWTLSDSELKRCWPCKTPTNATGFTATIWLALGRFTPHWRVNHYPLALTACRQSVASRGVAWWATPPSLQTRWRARVLNLALRGLMTLVEANPPGPSEQASNPGSLQYWQRYQH